MSTALDTARDEKKCRKWKSEIQLATKREKEWRTESEKIIKRYRGAEKKKNSFNILWANTDILRPAIYNSRPNPDVRRRFRDNDPIGKAVSEVLERGLSVVIDDYTTDCSIKNDVIDSLLPGRGLSRIRYEPKISSTTLPRTGSEPAQDGADAASAKPDADEEDEPAVEEQLEYERVILEHVDWQDFRHGYGRVWDEVMWCGFRCKMTEDEAEKKFGEEAIKGIKFTAPDIEDEKKREVATETEKVAEFWEIWDKATRTVFFTQENAQTCLYPLDTPNGEPPLELQTFYPIPEPLKIIENTGSLIPIPIYTLYEQQANELDKISARINKIVDTLKLRGAYDATLPEMGDILQGEDNDLTPITRAQAWMTNGGLDKAITWMPIEQGAMVLKILNEARNEAKQVIYEITGISDIIRGATMANETATAQQIKANYAAVRLQRMQREVQRYVRDLLRIAAEVIANKFEQQTLQQMTGLQFPTMQQKQMIQMQMQPGQPPDEQTALMLKMPTWEDIIGTLRNDALRMYKVDVETDSTVAGSLESDMRGLSEVVQGIGQTLQVFTPLVQAHVLPLEAAKEIVMSVVRRAKLGIAVEDALDKMQQPPPAPPEAQDQSPQVAQIKAQSDQAIAQLTEQAHAARNQAEQQVKAAQIQADQQKAAAEAQLKMQSEQMQKQHDAQLEQMRIEAENQRAASALETQRMIADANNQTKILIAEMGQQHAKELQASKLQADQQMAQLAAAKPESSDAPPAATYRNVEADGRMDAHLESMNKLIPVMTQMAFQISRPKKIIRDESGKIAGVE